MQSTRRAVINAIADESVSGPDLATHLGVSRAAIWKHVEALREAGFTIQSDDAGYRLTGIPDYGGPAIEFGLDAPFDIEYHDSLPSTNARARELATEGATDIVVVADEQTGGRGRLDRVWASPPGGIWLSIVCRPDVPPAHAPVVTLAAAVAATETAHEAGINARIKWPNDVLVAGENSERKLAGILTEMEGESDRVSWVIIGIGINVREEGLPKGATGLLTHIDSVDRRVLVQRLIERFDALRTDFEGVLPAWREHALTLGQRVRVELSTTEIVGRAVKIEFPGTLVIETDDGRRRVYAGDCEHLRPA